MSKKKNVSMLPISAKWQARVYRVDGRVEEGEWISNLVTDVGMDWLAEYLTTTPDSAMNYVAVGTGTLAPALTDTALGGEIARNAMASRTSSKNIWITTCTFAGAADSITSVAITEAGVFNASSGFDMFQRVQGTIATLGDSDFLQLTIETTIGSRSV